MCGCGLVTSHAPLCSSVNWECWCLPWEFGGVAEDKVSECVCIVPWNQRLGLSLNATLMWTQVSLGNRKFHSWDCFLIGLFPDPDPALYKSVPSCKMLCFFVFFLKTVFLANFGYEAVGCLLTPASAPAPGGCPVIPFSSDTNDLASAQTPTAQRLSPTAGPLLQMPVKSPGSLVLRTSRGPASCSSGLMIR